MRLRHLNKPFQLHSDSRVHKCKFDLRISLLISCIFHIRAIYWWGFQWVTIDTPLSGVFWALDIKYFTSHLMGNLQLVENNVFTLKVMIHYDVLEYIFILTSERNIIKAWNRRLQSEQQPPSVHVTFSHILVSVYLYLLSIVPLIKNILRKI